ncbi:MAG: hypothetical protein QF845_06015 [Candidatus Marinimicrobia bacterium]|jgi:hypothetical protein|nr:hypothetical protein [Candidatus Neomarinimicrobiota bacterium]MDP6790066.1 hypothetical protein [Candidatus Neomarinimicrobiota bacterium]MDP7071985.1 hypothetical protein [Candidatus Neomarinimicrobiota bacterium]
MIDERDDPGQLPLFPELAGGERMPSLATLPEFGQALQNLIRMSDLGAFIELNIQGLDKLYSINLRDLDVPGDFLKDMKGYTPLTVKLFSKDVRNEIHKRTYDIKSFFNAKNSFKTSFGFFLFRTHFDGWKKTLSRRQEDIQSYLSATLGKGKYGQAFAEFFKQGYEHMEAHADITAPWEFTKRPLLKDIEESRKFLNEQHKTLFTLKPTEIDFPFQVITLKTGRVPLVLNQFQSQVQIHSVFKTIHLEYLADTQIESLEDIRRLTEGM